MKVPADLLPGGGAIDRQTAVISSVLKWWKTRDFWSSS